MDKLRQKYLQKWLRAQQQPVKKLMRTNIALATLSSLILVAQTYFLATLLDKLIMQNVDRTKLIPYFIALIITFALRAFSPIQVCLTRTMPVSGELGKSR